MPDALDSNISGSHLNVRCHWYNDDRQACAYTALADKQARIAQQTGKRRELGGDAPTQSCSWLCYHPLSWKHKIIRAAHSWNSLISAVCRYRISVTDCSSVPSHIAALLMMAVGLVTALWGASSLSCASAFATPAFLSSVTSNAFVSRRTSLASSALQQQPSSLYQAAAAAAGASPATARRRRQQQRHGSSSGGGSGGGGGMVMLFDFIKKRAQEGVEQTQNLVTAAQTGRLDEALKETSAYVKDRRVTYLTDSLGSSSSCCCVGHHHQRSSG